MPSIDIRPATPADIPTIYRFICELAEYEKSAHEVHSTEALLLENLFGPLPYAEVILAELNHEPVGMALFFHNFSTWTGRPGIYLEDLYVTPAVRGKGVGQRLLLEMAKIAQQRNCARLDWSVLDWNVDAINFYRKLGAKPMDEWTVFRLDEQAIQNLLTTADSYQFKV